MSIGKSIRIAFFGLLISLNASALETRSGQSSDGNQYVLWIGQRIQGTPVVLKGIGDSGASYEFLMIRNVSIDGRPLGNLMMLPMEGFFPERESKLAFESFSGFSVISKIWAFARQGSAVTIKLSEVTKNEEDSKTEIIVGSYEFEYRTQTDGGKKSLGFNFK